MDNDFLEFYVGKCSSDIQGFIKFLEDKLKTLPKDESKVSKPDVNADQLRNESLGILEQMKKIVVDHVIDFFQRFEDEVEAIYKQHGTSSHDSASSALTPRKTIEQRLKSMKESLDKVKKKDSATLKSFFNYDFSKDQVQIENMVKTAPIASYVKPVPKHQPARVVANPYALVSLENLLSSIITVTYDEVPPTESLCQVTSKNYFLSSLDLPFRVVSGLVDDTNCLVQYNVEEESITKTPIPADNLAINPRVFALPDGTIFFIGGIKKGKPCSDTQSLDVTLGKMMQKSNMKFAKIGNAVCYLKHSGKDYLYSLGGKGDGKRLNVCERYSVLDNKWELAASMKLARAAATACTFDNRLVYCFGGFNAENIIEQSIERYDVVKDQWSTIALKNPSSYLPVIEASSVQINDNQVIILGGSRSLEDRLEVTRDIQILNVGEQVMSNLGGELTNMLNFGNQIIVHEQRLCCFGRLRKESKVFGPSDMVFTTIDEKGCSNGTIIDISGFEYL